MAAVDPEHPEAFGKRGVVERPISFFRRKKLEILIRDQRRAFAERLRVLRVHGSHPKYYHHFVAAISGSMRCRPRCST